MVEKNFSLYPTIFFNSVFLIVSSEQTGIVERKHKHIVEFGLTLLVQASVPLQYWSDAIFTAVFLINKLPSSALAKVTPHENHFGSSSDYSFLRVLGYLCFTHLHPFHKNQLSFRSEPCVFLRYCLKYQGYKCLVAYVYTTQNVVFHESKFPFYESKSNFFTSAAPTQTYTSMPFFSSVWLSVFVSVWILYWLDSFI